MPGDSSTVTVISGTNSCISLHSSQKFFFSISLLQSNSYIAALSSFPAANPDSKLGSGRSDHCIFNGNVATLRSFTRANTCRSGSIRLCYNRTIFNINMPTTAITKYRTYSTSLIPTYCRQCPGTYNLNAPTYFAIRSHLNARSTITSTFQGVTIYYPNSRVTITNIQCYSGRHI